MKGLLRSALILSCIGLAGIAPVKSHRICQGFVPENNYRIPVTFTAGGITEQQFNNIFDRFEKIYRPIIEKKGGKLRLNRYWSDGTVNAYAERLGQVYSISMFGGLARYPSMTPDGMALVVCHEAGHHLGGAPKIGGDSAQWATNEGGADYFGTLKCLRLMFAQDNNQFIAQNTEVDPTIQSACQAQYKDATEAAVCIRASAAGVVLGRVLGELGQESQPNVNTPDKSKVSRTDDSHPHAQCRLDTYFQASICPVTVATDVSSADYHQGSCTAPKFTIGLRPTCWFKPDSKDASGFAGDDGQESSDPYGYGSDDNGYGY